METLISNSALLLGLNLSMTWGLQFTTLGLCRCYVLEYAINMLTVQAPHFLSVRVPFPFFLILFTVHLIGAKRMQNLACFSPLYDLV